MITEIEKILAEINTFTAGSDDELEAFRIKYLSRKGKIPSLFERFKDVLPQDRKVIGQSLNNLKTQAQEKYNLLKSEISEKTIAKKGEYTDLTKPTGFQDIGARHPISVVRRMILEIFARIGYNVAEGSEIVAKPSSYIQ